MRITDWLLNAWLKGPDHPAKLRVADHILRRIKRPVETQYCGARLFVYPNDLIGRYVLLHGGFEPATLAAALSIMRDKTTFVDIGANIGLFSLAIARETSAACVAIEPNYSNFSMLKRNIALNQCNNIIAVNCAISTDPGIVAMHQYAPDNAGTHRLVTRSPTDPSNQSITWTSSSSLSLVLETLQIKSISCLKIDVEGYEYEILKMIDYASQIRPEIIICEYMDCPDRYNGVDHRQVFDFLISRGYEAFDIYGRALGNVAPANAPEHNIIYKTRAHMAEAK